MPKLALSLADARHFQVEEMIELARVAEATGFEAVFIGETWGWDVGMILAVIARSTSRIRLGAAILNIYARTPSAIAQHAATLDSLSGGRAIVGLGIATPAIVQDWHGIPFDRPYQRLKETVAILRQALGGQRLDHAGEVYRVGRFRLTVPPVQARIPIVLATSKPRNVELTGQIADGWAPAFSSPATLPRLRVHLEAGARSAGRDPAEMTTWASVRSIVSGDPEAGRRLIRRSLAYYLGSRGSLHVRAILQHGLFVDEIARIQEAWEKDPHAAEAAVPDAMLDAFSIAGDAATARDRLAAWDAAGADVVVLHPVVGTSVADTLGTIEAAGRAAATTTP